MPRQSVLAAETVDPPDRAVLATVAQRINLLKLLGFAVNLQFTKQLFAESLRLVRAPAKTILFREGEEGDSAFFLLEGKLLSISLNEDSAQCEYSEALLKQIVVSALIQNRKYDIKVQETARLECVLDALKIQGIMVSEYFGDMGQPRFEFAGTPQRFECLSEHSLYSDRPRRNTLLTQTECRLAVLGRQEYLQLGRKAQAHSRQFAKEIAAFLPRSVEQFNPLIVYAERCRFPPKVRLWAEGDSADSMLAVKQGELLMQRQGGAVLKVGRGSICGEEDLRWGQQTVRLCSVVSTSEVTGFRFRFKQLYGSLRKSTALACHLIGKAKSKQLYLQRRQITQQLIKQALGEVEPQAQARTKESKESKEPARRAACRVRYIEMRRIDARMEQELRAQAERQAKCQEEQKRKHAELKAQKENQSQQLRAQLMSRTKRRCKTTAVAKRSAIRSPHSRLTQILSVRRATSQL